MEEKKNREEYGGRDGDEEGRKGGNGEEGEKFLRGSNLRDNILIISRTNFLLILAKRGGGFHDVCSDTMNGGWFVYSGSRSIITSSPCLLCCYRTIPGNHRD